MKNELLKFERIDAVSDPMRALIVELWPQMGHKLAAPKGRLKAPRSEDSAHPMIP
jgi:hypothetical protein